MSIASRLGLGWLGDKIDKRWVAAGGIAMMSLGIFCSGYASTGSAWLLVPFLILFGIGFGGNNAMRVSILRESFGRTRFGTVYGLTTAIMMVGYMTSPPLTGWVFDNWGSYHGIWFVFPATAIAGLILIRTTPPLASILHKKGGI